MKNIYTLIAALFFFAISANAQETKEVFYKQDFNNTTTLPTDFDRTSATWVVSNKALNTNNPKANAVYSNKLVKNNVYVGGYMMLRIQWSGFHSDVKNGNDVSYYVPTVSYTTNLVKNTQTVKATESTTAKNQWNNTYVDIFLPEGTTSINFSINIDVHTKRGDYYGLDNLVLEGTADQPIAPLPVELISFKGATVNGAAKLTWATAQEKNNDRFVVERSQDGKSFSAIGEVKGNGTSATRIDYNFTDTNPAAGANYYRLRQIDFDGTEDFSKVVALNISKNSMVSGSAVASVFPTVASTEVKVNFALANAQVTVVDGSGRQVAQFANAERELVIPVSNLQRGVYFVTVTDGAERQTQRFVKQ